MWLFTVDGMFSVVLVKDDDNSEWSSPIRDLVEVRARRRGHLERLCRKCGIEQEIHKRRDSQNPYRISMSKDEFAEVIARVISDIDYDRFKEAAKRSRPRDGKRSGYIKLLDKVSEIAATCLQRESSRSS